jgi:hypothetical protein
LFPENAKKKWMVNIGFGESALPRGEAQVVECLALRFGRAQTSVPPKKKTSFDSIASGSARNSEKALAK